MKSLLKKMDKNMKRSVEFIPENSLAQQCYEQLQQEIIQGVLRPGEKLKVMPITERFGIGQSPVREALSKLSACGLVAVEENKGFRVATVSQVDIRDTYKVFTAIETTALAWAIKLGDEQWEADIVAKLHTLSNVECSEKAVPHSVWAERNYDFHVALISGCQSRSLLEIRRNLYLKFDRYCQMSYQLSKDSQHNNNECHKQLAQAVLQRDIKESKRLMIHHINGPLEDIIKQFKEQNLF